MWAGALPLLGSWVGCLGVCGFTLYCKFKTWEQEFGHGTGEAGPPEGQLSSDPGLSDRGTPQVREKGLKRKRKRRLSVWKNRTFKNLQFQTKNPTKIMTTLSQFIKSRVINSCSARSWVSSSMTLSASPLVLKIFYPVWWYNLKVV